MVQSSRRPDRAAVTGTDPVAGPNRWALVELTALNRDILAGARQPGVLAARLQDDVLTALPDPDRLTPPEARRLVVVLGLAGASVGRHHQEQDPAHRAVPEQAFAGLRAGPAGTPFREYFARIAGRTGCGHGRRDTYASLVRWNLPAVEAVRGGELLARLPSEFDDGEVRTYTGTGDERRFFELLKASEVLEAAVNHLLLPVCDGAVDLLGAEAVDRIGLATEVLGELRRLNDDFARLPADQGLRTDYFMTVFRQYAVHWEPGDVPPSGALDAEALIRDLLLGIDLPDYPAHLRKVFPGLLAGERATLSRLMDRPTLPQQVLAATGLDRDRLATSSAEDLAVLVRRWPVLGATYQLLAAHARAAGVHLRLSKQFLFAPQRARDRAGLGDPGVVSNRRGTTGMDESRLEGLTRARHRHLLVELRRLPRAAPDPSPRGGPGGRIEVRFTGVATEGSLSPGGPVDRSSTVLSGRPGRRVPRPRAGEGGG